MNYFVWTTSMFEISIEGSGNSQLSFSFLFNLTTLFDESSPTVVEQDVVFFDFS